MVYFSGLMVSGFGVRFQGAPIETDENAVLRIVSEGRGLAQLGEHFRERGCADLGPAPPAPEFMVPGFGFRVSGFGFRVPGVWFRVSGFGFRVSGFGCGVSGFGFRVPGSGFRVSGFGYRGSGFAPHRRVRQRLQRLRPCTRDLKGLYNIITIIIIHNIITIIIYYMYT